jgi:3-methylcrotonyl-CoA carboxylase alpha subunit
MKKILIANRGEIACRIIRTARAMGIATVAVYADGDARAQHVQQADEAVALCGIVAKDTYLRMDKIIATAKQTGADAIHPGYGFLSENAEFAALCAANHIVFIGPPPAAIAAMGSKSAAKTLMEKSGVPVVPGYHGQNQTIAHWQKTAADIGYPVLLKAVAGGGGKGMRRVDNPADLAEAVAGAAREAQNGFGNANLLMEKYVLNPRHIEIQVFADSHGNCVYLFERDCSIQRRHQKVVEEAPAPFMTDTIRRAMGQAAVKAAQAVNYVGAGTVEFIADDRGNFYFMEMNTRLQVEHPVTEMITGVDLVEWQIRIARGEKLPKTQDDLKIGGHAIEVRLYAEDPEREFLPAIGQLRHLQFPEPSPHIRVDTGFAPGDAITPEFDPLIAKIIAWGETRTAAIQNLSGALAVTEIAGLFTNLYFLRRVLAHPVFQSGKLTTHFIAEHRQDLRFAPAAGDADTAFIAVAAWQWQTNQIQSAPQGWRLSGSGVSPFYFDRDDEKCRLDLRFGPNHLTAAISGKTYALSEPQQEDHILAVTVDSRAITARILPRADGWDAVIAGITYGVDIWNVATTAQNHGGGLRSPMPGKVVQVLVTPGQAVKTGEKLLILEAMKMEHTIIAPKDGVIAEIRFTAGQQVSDGVELVVLS